MIEIQNLTKDYGSVRAVDDLTISVPVGQFFGFLGPNGAGKTTTIKVLSGLLRPTKGRIEVGRNGDGKGYDMATDALAAKAVTGYVPDTPYLYEKLTGHEFVHFIGGLYQVPEKVVEEKIEEYFHLLSLTDAAHELIESYSHGMRQKLVMTSALVHDPQVLVVDEPMVGLDPRSARTVKDLLKRKSKEGMTIFLSTHTLDVAEELCDRIAIVKKGRLIALGTLAELRARSTASVDEGERLEALFLKLTEDLAEDSTIGSIA